MPAPLLIPAIASGLQAGYGAYQTITAQNRINQLAKQRRASYLDTLAPISESQRMYEQQYRQGLTPATRTLAQQQFAGTQAGQQRAAMDLSGGQMSSALSRLGAANTGQFALGLAAQNEAAQRAGMAGLVNMNLQEANVRRQQVAQDIAYRDAMERNYGAAKQQGAMNILGAAQGLGTAGMSQYNADQNRAMYKSLYGGNNQSNPDVLYSIPNATSSYQFNDMMAAPGPEFIPSTSLPKGLGWGNTSDRGFKFTTPKGYFDK